MECLMFNLTADNLYDWQVLFLLISMERVTLFLGDLNFPFFNQLPMIQASARSFTRDFYEVELDLFSDGEISRAARDLFTATYDELARRLGPGAALRFCDWANRMQMDRRLEWALDHFWYDLFVPWAHTGGDHPPVIEPRRFQDTVKAIVARCDGDLKGMVEAVDIIDVIPLEGWDADAYRFYNQGHRRTIGLDGMTASPLGYLEALLTYTRICRALCQIVEVASQDELDTLIDWIDTQLPFDSTVDGTTLFQSVCPA
jgi:hypothetical protein